jgi:hypothetical protein
VESQGLQDQSEIHFVVPGAPTTNIKRKEDRALAKWIVVYLEFTTRGNAIVIEIECQILVVPWASTSHMILSVFGNFEGMHSHRN